MRRFLIFVLVLIAINLVLWLVGSSFRISIIGSIVLTLIISAAMSLFTRRSARG